MIGFMLREQHRHGLYYSLAEMHKLAVHLLVLVPFVYTEVRVMPINVILR